MTPPQAKDALREKLEKARRLVRYWQDERGNLDGDAEQVTLWLSEALALLDSEPSEQMRRDHEAMKILRATGARWYMENDWSLTAIPDWYQGTSHSDPADAILATDSEGES